MLPCLFDPKQHEIIPSSEILVWCKQEAPARDKNRLFLYRHRIHGTFVIAMWAADSPDQAFGIFTDFLNIGYSHSLTKEQADEFRKRMFAPVQAHQMANAINQAARDYKSEQQNEADEAQENVERGLKERGL